MARTTIEIPLQRVEGDLEIRAELEGGVVVDAWSAGTMYRGFENMLVGRGSLDGLVITPRVCGICSVAHLFAAARALDAIAGVTATPAAARVRNVAHMAEHVQSTLRHAFLMFTPDFTRPAHRGHSLYDEAVRRFRPFEGASVVETIRATKHLLEIVAILGGQWPHSSFMVPGGVVAAPSPVDVAKCRQILASQRKDYERRVLGCSIERWLEIASAADLDAWLDARAEHRDADLGFFLRFGREAGLDRIGAGYGNFLCVGGLEIPEGSSVRSPDGGAFLLPSGFLRGEDLSSFDQRHVTEDVACSWFADDDAPRHPFDGETRPYATGGEGKKYTWSKAPRYDGHPAETGPLAQLLMARVPLFVDLVRSSGPSALVRQLARIALPSLLYPAMDAWLAELASDLGPCCPSVVLVPDGEGVGLVEATRGALGHWVKIANGKIAKYQIVTPTAWNGSPRDARGVRGPWEQALVGTRVEDVEDPVALGYVVRSFDPCLVCTVHAFDRRGGSSKVRVRA
jgi:hydrogenase large subunit